MPNRPFRIGLIAIAVCAACAPFHRRTAPPPAIVFVNQSLDQADLYGVSSGTGTVRIGTVFAGRTDTLPVPNQLYGRTVNVVARVLSKSIAPSSGPIMLGNGDRVQITLPVDERMLTVLPASTP